MKLSTYIALLLIGLPLGGAQAQLSTGGKPYVFTHLVKEGKMPAHVLPPLNMDEVQSKERQDTERGLPPRFGMPVAVDLNLENSGSWQTLDNGDQLWQLSIRAPGATSVNLLYDDFWLPPGATLYLYNEDRTQVLGGFTARNNKGLREGLTAFATGLVRDDVVILEYYEPAGVAGRGQISIRRVVHGYRLPALTEENFGDSESCHNNVNCPEGADWQFEKRAVAMIVVDGFRWCSGSLLNTVSDEWLPYLLTANHCIDDYFLDAVNGSIDASDWVFYFNYESPACDDPPQDPIASANSVTGARLLANLRDSDFALFRLLENPLAAFSPAYLGWDATGNAPLSGAGLHHPRGDVMKVSIEDDPVASHPSSINWGSSVSPANSHWKVGFDDGGTEGGSSGSPFFNEQGRVVGQLHGGSSICPGDPFFVKYYGKLDWSWDAGGETSDHRRRLGDWLAPACGTNISVTDQSLGDEPVVRADSIESSSALGRKAFVRYEASGSVTLKPGFHAVQGSDFRARITPGCENTNLLKNGGNSPVRRLDSRSATGEQRAPAPFSGAYAPNISRGFEFPPMDGISEDALTISPNPVLQYARVDLRIKEAKQVSVYLLNALGQRVREVMPPRMLPAGMTQLNFDTGGLSAGTYYMILKTENAVNTSKLMIAR